MSTCSTCGRDFNPESLVRHAPICAKNVAKRPRKTFDVQKQRVSGTDINYAELKRSEKKKPSVKEMRAANKKHNWKEKHEDFISTVRSARGEPIDQPSSTYEKQEYGREQYENNYDQPSQKRNSNSGFDSQTIRRGPAPKAGFIQCPHCGRNFADESGERHMPFCEEQVKKRAMKLNQSQNTVAAKKMAARTQYKPPKPKSSGTGGGSSSFTPIKSSGYGIKSNQQQNTVDYDYDRYSKELIEKPRLAPSAGRRAKENVLSNTNKAAPSPKRQSTKKLRRTCHDCSTIYPVEWAKYCCECGGKRITG